MQRSEFYYTRKVISWLCFVVAMVCLILFFSQGMSNYLWLIACIVLFILGYWISPHRKKESNLDELVWDERVIEGFFQVVSYPIRVIVKVFQHIFD